VILVRDPQISSTLSLHKKVPSVIHIETVVSGVGDVFSSADGKSCEPVFMERATWKKIIDSSRGLGVTYRPYLFSEPLLDKRMPEIIRYIKKDPTAKVELRTNASLLTPLLSEELIALHVDAFCFQFSEDCLGGFKRQSDVSCTQAGIHVGYFLGRLRESGKNIAVQIELQSNKVRQDQFVAIKKFCEQYGSQIQVRFASEGYFPWRQDGAVAVSKPCQRMAEQITFFVDGTASLCSLDVEGRQLVGDIHERGVVDIWNGEEINRCRQLLATGQRRELALCRGCALDGDVDIQFKDSYTRGKVIPLITRIPSKV